MTHLGGEYTQSNGQMSLADAGRAEKNDVASLVQEAAGGQFVDLRRVFDDEVGSTYAEDATHYTALGNRRLARALLPAVLRALKG